MVHDPVNWRPKARRAALALVLVTSPLGYLDSPTVHAQSIMRSPNLNIGSRAPSISVAPRIDPNIAGRAVIGIGRLTPNLKTYQGCGYADRGSDGGCKGKLDSSAGGGGGGGAPGGTGNNGARRNSALTASNPRRDHRRNRGGDRRLAVRGTNRRIGAAS